MGFKEISGNRTYRAWKNWEEGDYLIGKVINRGEKPGYKGKGTQHWYDIEVLEANFPVKKGEMVQLNGAGALDYKMESVDDGQVVKVEYCGLGIVPEGKKNAGDEFHDIKVLVADDEEDETVSGGYTNL